MTGRKEGREERREGEGGGRREYQMNWSTWKEKIKTVHHLSKAALTLKAVDALYSILPIAI